MRHFAQKKAARTAWGYIPMRHAALGNVACVRRTRSFLHGDMNMHFFTRKQEAEFARWMWARFTLEVIIFTGLAFGAGWLVGTAVSAMM